MTDSVDDRAIKLDYILSGRHLNRSSARQTFLSGSSLVKTLPIDVIETVKSGHQATNSYSLLGWMRIHGDDDLLRWRNFGLSAEIYEFRHSLVLILVLGRKWF